MAEKHWVNWWLFRPTYITGSRGPPCTLRFNIRTRGLNSAAFWAAQMAAPQLHGSEFHMEVLVGRD